MFAVSRNANGLGSSAYASFLQLPKPCMGFSKICLVFSRRIRFKSKLDFDHWKIDLGLIGLIFGSEPPTASQNHSSCLYLVLKSPHTGPYGPHAWDVKFWVLIGLCTCSTGLRAISSEMRLQRPRMGACRLQEWGKLSPMLWGVSITKLGQQIFLVSLTILPRFGRLCCSTKFSEKSKKGSIDGACSMFNLSQCSSQAYAK